MPCFFEEFEDSRRSTSSTARQDYALKHFSDRKSVDLLEAQFQAILFNEAESTTVVCGEERSVAIARHGAGKTVVRRLELSDGTRTDASTADGTLQSVSVESPRHKRSGD